MAEKKGLQKIGLQIPKIVLKAAGNDPKRLKKIRELFGKKKQPKLPGMKSGSGENGVVYSDKKGKRISKEEARKRFIHFMINFLLCTQIAVVVAICFLIAKIY